MPPGAHPRNQDLSPPLLQAAAARRLKINPPKASGLWNCHLDGLSRVLILEPTSLQPLDSKRKLVGAVGIEPTTFGLKGRCSTTELRP
jgi:hypothetical protein